VEEEGAELNLEAEEGVRLEEDIVAVLQILLEEVKIKITVTQVIIDLINQRLCFVIIKGMDIMHMNAEREGIIRTSKVNIIQTMQIVPTTLCLWHALKQCL